MTSATWCTTCAPKLDASGHYDEFEVERVVLAEMNPKATQAMLVAAIEPVADRLLKRFRAAANLREAKSASSKAAPPLKPPDVELAALRCSSAT